MTTSRFQMVQMLVLLLVACTTMSWMMVQSVYGFGVHNHYVTTPSRTMRLDATRSDEGGDDHSRNINTKNTRRSFFSHVAGTAVSASSILVTTVVSSSFPQPAVATLASESVVGLISLDEFEIIVRDSGRSINRVEFTGPKNEIVTVVLQDNTAFGIKDIKESPTDPRSPLKVAAICREFGIRTKYPQLDAILATTPKKKKNFANARVQEAAAKEKERLARIQADEEERVAELARLNQKPEQ